MPCKTRHCPDATPQARVLLWHRAAQRTRCAALLVAGLCSMVASAAGTDVQTQQPNLIQAIDLGTQAPPGTEQQLQRFLGMPLIPQVRRAARQSLLALLAGPQGEWTVDTTAALDAYGRWRIQLSPPPRAATRMQQAPSPAVSRPARTTRFDRWVASDSPILIDRSTRQLWLKTDHGPAVFPVAVGRPGHATPVGRRRVQAVAANPVWYPTPGMHRDAARQGRQLPRSVPPGPANPLGSHFIALGNAIGIHGTNAPGSIGQAVSRGCVRMHPKDILTVAAAVKPGDDVWIVASLDAAPQVSSIRQRIPDHSPMGPARPAGA